MPPKKKGSKKKKTLSKQAPILIPIDDKLPVLCNLKSSVLVETIRTGDVLSLKRLVTHYDYGNTLSKTDVNGSTPLHIAVKNNDIKTIQLLLDYEKININAFEIQIIGGNTALHHACIEKNLAIIQLLLKYGAQANIRSNSINGETPLQICCKLGFIEGAKYLIHSNALIDMKDNYGNNASFWAYKYGQRELIQQLNLPLPRSPTAEEFLALMIQKNPNFQLPSIKIKVKKKKEKDGKKKK